MSGENNILEKAIIETKTKLLATKTEENEFEQKRTEAKRKIIEKNEKYKINTGVYEKT